MLDYNDSTSLNAAITPGKAVRSWPLYPRLTLKGEVEMLPGERVLAVQAARNVSQQGYGLSGSEDFMAALAGNGPKTRLMSMAGATTLVVSSLRTGWVVTDPEADGDLITGHIWHAWLDQLTFNPKQSFLRDSALRLHLTQDVGATGWYGHTIEFVFDKQFDPSQLATVLAQAVARHQLEFGAPAAFHTELNRLTTARVPGPPPKGERSEFAFPTRVRFPRLPARLAPENLAGDWLGPGED